MRKHLGTLSTAESGHFGLTQYTVEPLDTGHFKPTEQTLWISSEMHKALISEAQKPTIIPKSSVTFEG